MAVSALEFCHLMKTKDQLFLEFSDIQLHLRKYITMAPEGKKRLRPQLTDGPKSKKRQKITSAKNAASKPQKRAVVMDALPWNEVKMPDMYDDAEGFFGLEEVEGVEIVKEGGNVRFVSLKITSRKLQITVYI